MVWFQCEDCGESLKKPKVPSHFKMCRANKLSCIDCGEMFGRDTVQGHNQCITEAEKYGPKGQSKSANGTPAKPKDISKQEPDFDINVGLSNRYPWFCSLCNTKATSQQTLLAHADGKKHRGKAKAFHARQQQEQSTTLDNKDGSENASNVDSEQKKVDLPASSGVANGESHPEKKRKLETLDETSEGEEAKGSDLKKAKKQDHEKKINWKKLITSALKSVNLSSRFTVDGKYVKLVAKD